MIRVWLQGFALAVLALASAWLLSLLDKDEEFDSEAERHDPDFYMHHFTAVSMDKSGRPARQIAAEKMVHFPDTDTNELTEPRILIHGDDNGRGDWHIVAENGWISSDNSVVLLQGPVELWQEDANKEHVIDIITRDMRILLKDDYVETDKPARISTGSGQIESDGFRAYIDERRIQLLSRVKTQYDISPLSD